MLYSTHARHLTARFLGAWESAFGEKVSHRTGYDAFDGAAVCMYPVWLNRTVSAAAPSKPKKYRESDRLRSRPEIND